MNSRMQLRTRNFSLTLGVLLSLAGAGTICAASDAPAVPAVPAASAAATPAEQLETLQEVFVHGKKLATEISQAEDDLYFLYNRLNHDRDYDIVCGNMSLDRGSLITTRVCVPGFVADEVAVYTPGPGMRGTSVPYYSGFGSGYGGCNGSQPIAVGTDLNGSAFYEADCVPYGGTGYSASSRSYSPGFGASTIASIQDAGLGQARAAQLVTPQRRKAYADHVMDVIHSDLRLTKIATRLVGLYQEMDSVRGNYVQRKAEVRAARAAAPAKPNFGPRAMRTNYSE